MPLYSTKRRRAHDWLHRRKTARIPAGHVACVRRSQLDWIWGSRVTKPARKSTRQPITRVCANEACQRDFGVSDPLPYEAAVHYEADTFAITCSAACRAVLKWRTHRSDDRCAEACGLCGTAEAAQ